MKNNDNPLLSLLIDEEEIEKRADSILSSALASYVQITKTGQQVQFLPKAHGLKGHQKVLLALASKLVAQRLDLLEDATMSQKELIDQLKDEGVAEGTVKSALNKLRSAKLLSKTDNSRYYLGTDKLIKLESALEVNTDE
ncbi:MAG TPA: hypothetical protein PKD19_03590 [Candidatus Saccharibacteria bacterium]|nr:hypothetical protein [Candidatus Saccharibacteria bacterium]